MRRTTSHISLIALLATLCLIGSTAGCAMAAGSPASSSINKAALDKAVQEALAKDKLGTSVGTQNPAAAGAETPATGEAFGAPSESSSSLTSKAGEEEATPTTATTSSATSSISTSVVIPILIICALLLGGIAFFIVRDSRNVAPVGDGLSGNSVQDRAARQRKRRAKAKAARQQRKRNR